jgi:hypothetical protein
MGINYEDIENRIFVKKYDNKDLLPSNVNQLFTDNLFEEHIPLDFEPKIFIREDSTDFETTLQINSKNYCISSAVLKEIFTTMKFLIEEINSIDYWDINIIETNIDARFTDTEKIEYLKEKRKELYLAIQNEPEYFVYTGKREFNGFNNWEELIYDILLYEDSLVKKFLTEDIGVPDIPKTIFTDWHNYYKTNELIKICEKKINELILEDTVDSIEQIDEEKTKKISAKNVDLSFQLALLEEIMKLENWDDISANKKGFILTNLIGKSKDNIKNYYNESAKSQLDQTSKFYNKSGKYATDKLNASKLLKEILG